MADFDMDPVLFEAIHKHWREFKAFADLSDTKIHVTNTGAEVGERHVVGKFYTGLGVGEVGSITFLTRSGELNAAQKIHLMNFVNSIRQDGSLREIRVETIE